MENEKKLLITGFDPFGSESINPSYEVVKLLPDCVGNIKLYKLQLPTSYKRAPEMLRAAIDDIAPDFIIMLGQAGGRASVTPERVAINCMDGKLADNDGIIMTDTPIVSGADTGDAAYFSTLPIRKMVDAVSALGIPAAISNTAGTFVCNCVMYEVLRYVSLSGKNTPAGFIHIPYLPSQAKKAEASVPSLELSAAVSAVKAAIETLL